MQVEITVKVDGRLVKTHVQDVQGNLEQMEETIHALGKRVSNEALQASVDALTGPRPLFRKTAGSSVTGATSRERSPAWTDPSPSGGCGCSARQPET
jgi:hypothetical protein